jgi:hypothetical protein
MAAATCDQALECVLADRPEHPEAHVCDAARATALLTNQAFVDKRFDARQGFDAEPPAWIAHVGHRIEREAAGKHPESTKQCLLRAREQLVTPVDRASERALPRRLIAATAFQQAQPMIESIEQRLRRQYACPRRRELDGQR